MYYREWCATTRDRKGFLLPETEVFARPGYTSVFAFRPEDAAEIKQAGHSRGFAKYPVTSDELVIDLDDGSASVPAVTHELTRRGASFDTYSSGGKGYHFIVKVTPTLGTDTPTRHRALALQIAPSCDTSLYFHNSLVRLPGTVHELTGAKKRLIGTCKGSVLELPEVAPAAYHTPDLSDRDMLAFAFDNVSRLLLGPSTASGRRRALWGVCEDFHRAGAAGHLVQEVLRTVNQTFSPPKEDSEVQRVFHSRYPAWR